MYCSVSQNPPLSFLRQFWQQILFSSDVATHTRQVIACFQQQTALQTYDTVKSGRPCWHRPRRGPLKHLDALGLFQLPADAGAHAPENHGVSMIGSEPPIL